MAGRGVVSSAMEATKPHSIWKKTDSFLDNFILPIGMLAMASALVLNLIWNINTLDTLDTRLNSTCVAKLGSVAAGNMIRQELFTNVFSARFTSWIIFGIQAAILLGVLISWLVAQSKGKEIGSLTTASTMFALAYALILIMIMLYGVLLGYAYNNGVSYAWERSDGSCAGSYKNSYSQAGIITISAALSAMYAIMHVVVVPLSTKSASALFANAIKKLQSGHSVPFTFLKSYTVYLISLAFFIGQFAIAMWLWARGVPSVHDSIIACGNSNSSNVSDPPPEWLVGVGENTDADGITMAVGISIVSGIYFIFSIGSIVYEYVNLGERTEAQTDEHFVHNVSFGWWNVVRFLTSVRVAIVMLLLVMWGRLVYMGNSNWLPQIYDSLRFEGDVWACDAPNNFTGPHIWIGAILLLVATAMHESFRWHNILSHGARVEGAVAAKFSMHPALYTAMAKINTGARSRFAKLDSA